MLDRLQQQLSDTYQTERGYDVRDFLITDHGMARALSGDNFLTNSGETLLMYEEEDGLSLSLYLDKAMLERIESMDPSSALQMERLNDLCKVIEGLSHFNYAVWKASQDRSMSLLELEMQAEIDKFVSTMQLALDQRDNDMLNGLHARLFDRVSFHRDLDHQQAERYRDASEFAARFCRGLRKRFLRNGDGALTELRHFYRLPLQDKISHIHAHAFAAN